MLNNIHIYQDRAVKYFPTLDLVDFALFHFIKESMLAEKTIKRIQNNKQYLMIKHNWVIERMPLLNIGTRQGLFKRLKKLCDADLLESSKDNKGDAPYYCMGSKYELYLFSDNDTTFSEPVNNRLHPCKQPFTPPVNNRLHPCKQPFTPPVNNRLHNDVDTIGIDSNKEEKEEEIVFALKNAKTLPLLDLVEEASIELHTCNDTQEDAQAVLAQNKEGTRGREMKIMPDAIKKLDGLSKMKKAQAVEVMQMFIEATGKNVALTKQRLGYILARLSEQTLRGEDFVNIEPIHFKAVFEYKTAQWQNDAKMSAYIRIETLCSTNFCNYLEEAREAYKNAKNKQTKAGAVGKKTRIGSIG